MTPVADTRSGAPAAYLGAFAVMGMAAMLLGPSIAGLHRATGLSEARLGLLFSASSFGYLTGLVAAGALIARANGHTVLASGILTMGAAVVAVPHCHGLAALCIAELVLGFGIGVIEIPCNSLILWTVGGGALLNALHACWALGAVLAPLLVGRSIAWTGGLSGAYVIVAACGFVPLLLLRNRVAPPNPHVEIGRGIPSEARGRVALVACFYFANIATEATFAGWIYRYGELRDISAATAIYLGAAFLGAFAIGRMIGVVVARSVAPFPTLLADHAVSFAAVGVLLLAPNAPAAIWIGTVLFGLGMASMFANMLGMSEPLVPSTGTVTSLYLVGSSLGGIVVTGSMGALLDRYGAVALPVVAAIGTLATLAIVVTLELSARRRGPLRSS